jgi:hypothetical protein
MQQRSSNELTGRRARRWLTTTAACARDDDDVILGDGRRLILRSPNGHFWNVTVDNLGALTATDMGTTL